MLTLFTVSVAAAWSVTDPMTVVETVGHKLVQVGLMDAAVTFGNGVLSYTAQVEAVDAAAASIIAMTPFMDLGARLTHIEVEPCLQVESVPMAV